MTYMQAHTDLLAPAAQVRVERQPSVLVQARRALMLVFCLGLGLNAFGAAALDQLRHPSAKAARPIAAPVPASVEVTDNAAPATLRLDTGVVSPGQTSLILRSSADARARITVHDGAKLLVDMNVDTTAGAPIRVPVRVGTADHDRMLSVRTEAVGGTPKVLAVRVQASRVQLAANEVPVAAVR